VVFLDLQMPYSTVSVWSARCEANHFRRLADLAHREVAIGSSGALAACESIRISV
jgi:hypothetical protein